MIAFPGGKSEGDETTLEAAIWETHEEIDIDISGKHFAYVGRVPQNIPFFYMPGDWRMYVQPHIFVQTSLQHPEDEPELIITENDGEIDAHIWTPLDYLCKNDQRFFHWWD